MEARAAVTDGRGGFAIRGVDVAPPGPGEVLVRLEAAGLCHTDWDEVLRAPGALVLGHEGAGTVQQVGAGVDGVHAGQRVLLTWAVGCGRCTWCARGKPVLCEMHGILASGSGRRATTVDGAEVPQSFTLGTLASHTVVRQEAVVPLTVDIPATSACLLGCGVMTAWGSVVNAARVEPGSTVAVLGCGGVGLNVVQSARIAGAARVIAVDVDAGKLALAESFGATETVLASRDDAGLRAAAAQVARRTGGCGADYAFECTAVPELADAPLAMIRHGGTAVQVSGVEQVVSFDAQLFEWDKTYLNPLYGLCRPAVDFPRLQAMYAAGVLEVDRLVSRTYRLDDLADGFADLLAGRNAKGVVVLA